MGEIFDRKLLRKNQCRFQRYFKEHDFLYHEASSYMLHDIEAIKRDFECVLQISAKDQSIIDYISRIKNVKQKFCSSMNNFKHTNIVLDDELLPFKDESFDLVISNLNIHHINKVPEFLLQTHSVLKKGGFFIASFFGENNLVDLKRAVFEAENETLDGVSARFMPVIDIKSAANLLQSAGFRDPVASLDVVNTEYSNPKKILTDIKLMGQGNILLKRSKKFVNKKFLDEIYNKYAKISKISDNSFNVKYEIIIVSGWK
tara:strand:+ start:1587 stop:2363 length:777 start_codon:yes stop_codon:yes gene_type:complete